MTRSFHVCHLRACFWTLTILLAGCGSRGGGSPSERNGLAESRQELAPEVRRVLESDDHNAHMARNYVRYASALGAGGDALDAMVAPDVRLNDLEPLGFTGLAGLKEFRRQRNEAFQYDRSVVTAMRFPAADITDVDICTERTDVATGGKRVIVIHARDRWVDDKVVERWHRAEELPADSGCGP